MIYVYGTETCGGCKSAKMFLKMKHIPFEIKNITNEENLKYLKDRGFESIPQIYRNDVHLGGYNDLKKMKPEEIIG